MKHLHSHSVVLLLFHNLYYQKKHNIIILTLLSLVFLAAFPLLSTRGSGAPFPVAWKDLSG